MTETPRIYAHRGRCGRVQQYPENTAASFDAARRSPYATGSEGDIQRTQDGIAIILHENLKRTTNVKEVFPHLARKEIIRAQDLRLGDIKRLDAGSGEEILTVEEFARQFPTSSEDPYHFAYEIKSNGIIGEVLETALSRGPLEHSIFISFDDEQLAAVKDEEPEAQTFKLFRQGDTVTPLITSLQGHGIGVRIDDCPDSLLDKAKRYRVPVLAYSPMVESEDFGQHVARLYRRRPQVHGLILNEPNDLPQYLARKKVD